MEGDEERLLKEIEGCLSELRCNLEAVATSRAIDDSVLLELMQITDEIERHIGAVTD